MNSAKFDTHGNSLSPLFRDFKIVTAGYELMHYGGIGITLFDVIRQRDRKVQEAWKEARDKGTHYSPFLNDWGDELVWEGPDLLAVLSVHLSHDNQSMKVTAYLFDTDCGRLRPGRVWDWTDDEASAGVWHRANDKLGYDPPARELPYRITEGNDEVASFSADRTTLDEILNDQVKEYDEGQRDRGVWQGGRLLAIIREGDDDEPVVVRFDGEKATASATAIDDEASDVTTEF